ncbi:MAG: MopE-related protein [Myxococcota bacterium]
MARAALWTFIALLGASHAAFAAPTNGDFEATLSTGWTDASTNGGEAVRVAEGDNFSSETDTTGISFVSTSHALMLRGGSEGGSESEGGVESEAFLVSHVDLAMWHRNESSSVRARTFVIDDGSGAVLSSADWAPSVGAFTEQTVDMSALCGTTVRVQLRGNTSNSGTPDPDGFVLFDDVNLGGDLCPIFADNDGDQICGQGIDLNSDGDCLDGNESSFNAIDCDDSDPSSFPGASEVPGDGIDQDCDGVDDPGPRQITGTLFEDVDADGRVSSDPGLASARLRVYRDGGDGFADGFDDAFVLTTTTNASGNFQAGGLGAQATYWVVIDSTSLTSSIPVRSGRTLDAVWAEQTWGPAGALCANGEGGTDTRPNTGSCFGGRVAGRSDVPSDLELAEHVIEVPIGTSNVSHVGAAFSFTVVTHAVDGDDDLGTLRTVQGSFRQFLDNVNALDGAHTLRFVPATPPTTQSGNAAWWTVTLEVPTVAIVATDLEIDGRAFCNGITCPLDDTRNENPGFLAAFETTVGVGPDLVPQTDDEPFLSTIPRPELEIDGVNLGAMQVDARVFVHDVALRRLGLDVTSDGTEVQAVVIGASAAGSTSERSTIPALTIAANDIEIRASWIETEADAIVRSGRYDGLRVEQNTIVAPPGGHADAYAGVRIDVSDALDQALDDLVLENLFEGLGGPALVIEGPGEVTGLTAVNNSMVANGFLDSGAISSSPSAILAESFQGDDVLLACNIVWANAGDGLTVTGSATGVALDANAFSDNLGLPIDLDGDGVTVNDGALNVDSANEGLDAPVITETWIDGAGQLNLLGFVGTAATPFAEATQIEWLVGDDDGTQDGPIELGGPPVPRGEPFSHIAYCTTELDGTFACQIDAASAGVVHDTPIVGISLRASGASEAGNVVVTIQDSDEDGLSDPDEVKLYNTDPNDIDTDDDDLPDGEEVLVYNTTPTEADTDGDLLLDGEEIEIMTDPTLADTDGGGTDDGTELLLALTDPLDASDDAPFVDSDRDLLTDADEAKAGTDPKDPDSDDDGLLDGEEVRVEGTNPLVADTDGDTLSDGDEVIVYLTSPVLRDTDGGGLADDFELFVTLTNPLDPIDDDPSLIDSDFDGLTDVLENKEGTDPNDPDTDGDGLLDGDEVNTHSSSPLDRDTDRDGLADGDEVDAGLDPALRDTDGGGVEDGHEVFLFGTDPTDGDDDPLDTDGDGLLDDAEQALHGTDPNLADTDGDGLSDGQEVLVTNTQPTVADSDGDGLDDYAEAIRWGTDPNVADTDGDGLQDGDEVQMHGSDPRLADTDGGGAPDGLEVVAETDPQDPADDLPVTPDDRDGDGLADDDEANQQTDPDDPDTDDDGLLDGDEVERGTDPLVQDTDGGGIEDGLEVAEGADPLDPSDDATIDRGPDEPLTGGSGCACDASGPPPLGSAFGVVLLVAGWSRRRRRTVGR